MFGYVTVNKPELKIREFALYQSYYCGLCRKLRQKYGIRGQVTLTYDLTFLVVLLSGLYEPREVEGVCRCAVHPLGKHPIRYNRITEYAADMNLLLAYYKCQDDWNDEKKWNKALLAGLLRRNSRQATAAWQQKTARIQESLQSLYEKEKRGITDLDQMAGLFGQVMAELFDYKADVWSPHLRKMGFYLGKFIYLMDAYEDVEADQKQGSYNPLISWKEQPDFEEKCRRLLTMMMTECCREFELLPIIKNAEILRNILYSGVWCRFEQVTASRKEKQEKKDAGSL